MPDPAQGGMRAPATADIRSMLSDICTNSEAEVSFDNLTFTINGSDDAVKAAMTVINQIPFVMRSQYQMRVKIELANEHKEFVSGKKNGKINKIMGQSEFQQAFSSDQILTLCRQRSDYFRRFQRVQFLHRRMRQPVRIDEEWPGSCRTRNACFDLLPCAGSIPQADYRNWWTAHPTHHEEILRLCEVLERYGPWRDGQGG
jgi:hypothetical protein